MEKKTKLTISGSAKKSIKNIEIAKTQGKDSVVIQKQSGKFSNAILPASVVMPDIPIKINRERVK